ncbi:hypothetical protein [Wolbachia endosymbiont of Psylliodes chrysocephala]|uniref:hypothetical protein n=1 Tax=Wolbachia endosymbiont of Psylliodes chrysocephala TaxID=2883236 RepID=UPI0020A0C37B|nr:hypothetical protein [Wolbachia endosymbiont of Psylliodes chrysocephala]
MMSIVSSQNSLLSSQCVTHNLRTLCLPPAVVSSQCLTLGSSIHYSPFGLCFHGKCKSYLQAKPAGSQCQLLA